MSSFNGFRQGCPGQLRVGELPYINPIVYFQAEGETLRPEDAGKITPDAVRVVPVDDHQGTTYRDSVYALDQEAYDAQTERADSRVPEGNITMLTDDEVQGLNDACNSCHLSEGEACPVLDMIFTQSRLPRT
jgi:hypothetical protein